LDELGLIIDSGVRAGANEVRSIRYEFSDGRKPRFGREQLKKRLRMQNARLTYP
jgi:uncharacterized protein YggE